MSGNGFCPKCGAVMPDYVCQSCGYIDKERKRDVEEPYQDRASAGRYSGAYSTDHTDMEKEHMKQKGSVAGKVVLALCLITVLVLVVLLVVFGIAVNTAGDFAAAALPALRHDLFSEYGYDYDYYYDHDYSYDYDYHHGYDYDYDYDYGYDYDYDYDYSYGTYVPSASDAYYEQIVNCTVRGLSYDIAWNSVYTYADDDDMHTGYSMLYPSIIGSQEPFVQEINDKIEAHAKAYPVAAVNGEDLGYLDTYVTYMTEDVLSVVFLYQALIDQEPVYRISALNFNMLTGEQLTKEEILPDFEFIPTFREVCIAQNGTYAMQFLDMMDDEQIRQAIYDEDSGVAFYSPVGIETGFNYAEGWVTATLKYGRY